MQDGKKLLLCTDLALFSQNSDIWGLGGYVVFVVLGFFSAQHCHPVRTEDKNFETKKAQVT